MEEDPYTVVDIVDSGDVREPRGSRTKFWIRFVGEAGRWLLKFPRPNTGEHLGREGGFRNQPSSSGFDCARVELARYYGPAVAGHEDGGRGDDQEFLPEGELATICRIIPPGGA